MTTARELPADPALFNAIDAYYKYVTSQARKQPNQKTISRVDVNTGASTFNPVNNTELKLSGDCLLITIENFSNVAAELADDFMFEINLDNTGQGDFIPFLLRLNSDISDPPQRDGKRSVFLQNIPFGKIFVRGNNVAGGKLTFIAFGNNVPEDMPSIFGQG